jgi:hypothetical protein
MQAAHYTNAFIWKRGCVLIYFMKYTTNTRGELMAKQFDGSLRALVKRGEILGQLVAQNARTLPACLFTRGKAK